MRQPTRAALPVLAVAVGLSTWALAHALTYLLFAHIHDDDFAVVHLSNQPELATFAAAGILASVAVARICATVGTGVSRRLGAMADVFRFGSLTTVYAPAAFVLVEFVQHLVVGDEGPPVALIVIGLVLHAATGVLTTVLWVAVGVRVVRAVVLLRGPIIAPGPRRPMPIIDAPERSAATVTPLGVRGPPEQLRRTISACLV